MPRGTVSKATTRIELDGGFWIEAKQELDYEDKRKLRRPFIRFGLDGGIRTRDEEMEEANPVLIVTAVCDWNVEDEHGQKVPITLEGVNSLSEDVANLILAALGQQYQPVTEERKNG